jgi:hypothetical protein
MKDELARGEPRGIDLQGLPTFAPHPALWSRVVAAEQRRRRMRRWRRSGLALAAALVACVILLLPRPLPSLQQQVVAGQQESRTLERQWQDLAAHSRADATGFARVRAIDATLQAAYDRGARADELAPLWHKRNRALRGLITHFRDAGPNEALAVTRI